MKDNSEFENVDEYIALFPESVQKEMTTIRQTIKEEAPQAKEIISWRMPTFYFKENLIHFAGYKKHIGLYPTPSAILKFKDELIKYKTSKGAIQFSLNEPMPIDLIRKIVKYRVEEVNKRYS